MKSGTLCGDRPFPEHAVRAASTTTNQRVRAEHAANYGVIVTQAVYVQVGIPFCTGQPVASIETVIGTIEALGLPFNVQAFCS